MTPLSTILVDSILSYWCSDVKLGIRSPAAGGIESTQRVLATVRADQADSNPPGESGREQNVPHTMPITPIARPLPKYPPGRRSVEQASPPKPSYTASGLEWN